MARESVAQSRWTLARAHLLAARLDEATDEYVWLWQHMVESDPAMYGVRHTFLVEELKRLVATHRPAMDAFLAIRAAVAPPEEGEPDHTALTDWLCLNAVLGREAESLAWYDRARVTVTFDGRMARLLESIILPILLREQRWGDAGELYTNPLARIPQLRLMRMQEWRAAVASLVRALRAARRFEEANAAEVAARDLDPSHELEAMLDEVRRA